MIGQFSLIQCLLNRLSEKADSINFRNHRLLSNNLTQSEKQFTPKKKKCFVALSFPIKMVHPHFLLFSSDAKRLICNNVGVRLLTDVKEEKLHF